MAQDAHRSPLMEFDPNRVAFIEPSEVKQPADAPTACVLTWFHDAAQRLVDELGGRLVAENRWEDGPHPLHEVMFRGTRVGIVPMPVTGAAAGSLVEEVIALGCGRSSRAAGPVPCDRT